MLSKVLLQDLQVLAPENSGTDLLDCGGEFLGKRMKNTDYLEEHLVYQKELEELPQGAGLFVKPAEGSDET